MAWLKLIRSGSNAELNNLVVTNSVTASYFKGDGSDLSGINTGSNYSRITSSFYNFSGSALNVNTTAEFFLGSCSIALNNISSSVYVSAKADFIKTGAAVTINNSLIIRRNYTGTQVGQDASQTFLGAASLPATQWYSVANFGIDQPFSSSLTYSLWTKSSSNTGLTVPRCYITAIEMAAIR